jgi:two-component system, NarL family, nitrate/nitrite response regulator NarL
MLPSDSPLADDTEAVIPACAPASGHLLAGLPFPAAPAAGNRMTMRENGRKIARGGALLMKVLLAADRGLFADAFCGSLSKLAPRVEIERCDPERVAEPDPGADFRLVLIDADAVPGNAASVVRGCRENFPDSPIVALASALDEAFIATIMRAGAQAYLPKSYSEAQVLGVLQVVLQGASHRPQVDSAPAASDAQEGQAPGIDAEKARRGGGNPYSLTGRELEVLTQVCEGRSNLNIAKRLGITEGTVKIHLSNSYKKLGVENRAQAIRIVERLDQVRNIALDDAEQGASLRDWLLPHMSHETHRKGEVLFRKGDPARALYFIQQGTVALPEISKEMTEGALFGEIGIFLPEHTRSATARCETDAQLFCLTAERAKRLFFENPQFAYHVMQLIAGRLRDDQTRPH